MSTQLHELETERGLLQITEFLGPAQVGPMLQLTQGSGPTREEPDEPGFIQISMSEAATIVPLLVAWMRDESAPLADAWVDVNERRPEMMGYVLCACEGGNVDTSFYDPTARRGFYFDLSERGYNITHWMPLPKAPEASK